MNKMFGGIIGKIAEPISIIRGKENSELQELIDAWS